MCPQPQGLEGEEAGGETADYLFGTLVQVSAMVAASVRWILVQLIVQRAPSGSALGEMSKLQLIARILPVMSLVCLLWGFAFEEGALSTSGEVVGPLLCNVLGMAVGVGNFASLIIIIIISSSSSSSSSSRSSSSSGIIMISSSSSSSSSMIIIIVKVTIISSIIIIIIIRIIIIIIIIIMFIDIPQVGVAALTVAELQMVKLTSAVAFQVIEGYLHYLYYLGYLFYLGLSRLSVQVLGTLHQIPLVCAGVLVYHDRISPLSVCGWGFCVLGTLVYGALRRSEAQAQAALMRPQDDGAQEVEQPPDRPRGRPRAQAAARRPHAQTAHLLGVPASEADEPTAAARLTAAESDHSTAAARPMAAQRPADAGAQPAGAGLLRQAPKGGASESEPLAAPSGIELRMTAA